MILFASDDAFCSGYFLFMDQLWINLWCMKNDAEVLQSISGLVFLAGDNALLSLQVNPIIVWKFTAII